MEIRHVNNGKFGSFVLGADIGATNSNFAIAGVKDNKATILFTINFLSQELVSFVDTVNKVLFYASTKGIKISKACIGAAGPVSPNKDFCQMTHVDWSISKGDILKKTSLKSVLLVNDFELIGFSVNTLQKKNIHVVRQIKKPVGLTKAIIGAGTGIGQVILNFDKLSKSYVPLPSEGGHSDFPVYDKFEFDLVQSLPKPVSYDLLVSGKGINNIYQFIKKDYKSTKYTKEIAQSKDKVPLISKYRKLDPACKAAFKIYTKFYARACKNFALESLPLGGLYIAGGVAAKHLDIFNKDFLKEFHSAIKLSGLLRDIPIYIIKDYGISLRGACFAAI